MHYLKPMFPFILAAATLSSAQQTDTTTTSSADNAVNTKCEADNAVKQCVQSMKSNLDKCTSDDRTCQCINSASVVGCYNDCPNDPASAGAQSIHERNCAKTSKDTPALTTSISVTASTSSTSISVVSSETATVSQAATTNGSYDNDSDSDDNSGFKEGHPTMSFSGLESNNELSESAKEGGASSLGSLKARSWIGLLGLSLGIFL